MEQRDGLSELLLPTDRRNGSPRAAEWATRSWCCTVQTEEFGRFGRAKLQRHAVVGVNTVL